MTRLSYVITPKSELLQTLNLKSDGQHEICRYAVVITPIRDYEEAFEGWHPAWISKAKHDFVTCFVDIWEEDFPTFIAELRKASPIENFDRWWNITKSDVIEIDGKWAPEKNHL